jgi:DNA-directed RNA polymerase I, II, and III subunit RPABC1
MLFFLSNHSMFINRFLRNGLSWHLQVIFCYLRMADTPLQKREQVIALHSHTSKKVREIASDLQLSKSAVDRIIRRWRDTGNVGSDKQGNCGRKRKLTEGDKKVLVREIIKDPRKTARELKLENPFCNDVSVRTVKRAVLDGGMRAYRPVGVPCLNKARCRSRLEWANLYNFYDSEDWKEV